MKRIVTLGMGQGGLWLALAGQELPAGARVIPKEQARFWLRQSVPPMAHPTILHALSDIADALGYPFHGAGAMAFDEVPMVLEWLEDAMKAGRLVGFHAASTEGGGKGPSPEPPKPPDPPKPEPTPVNPVIEPATLVVVVRKLAKDPASGKQEPYTHPKRQAFTLKTDAAFDGTATFTCDKPDKVKFFSAAKDGTEIKFDGTLNVFKPGSSPPWAKGATISGGVTVYAEGAAPSDGLDDIKIKLALSGGSKPVGPEDSATITSVEVTLDICKSRPSAGAEPPKLSKDDKVHVGRDLLVQNAARTFERAQLVIAQVKPAAFKGTLVLKAQNGKVTAFKTEDPAPAAQAPIVPFEIAADKVPAAGEKLWAQSTAASTDLRDTGFTLGIKDLEEEGDKVSATSVEIKLDICQSRTAAQAAATPKTDPSAMSEEDKTKVGRFVHLQNAGKHHGRALLIVRKVKPEKWKGALTLDGITVKTDLFPAEDPASAAGAVAVPKDIDYSAEKNEDKKFWVQGKTKSAALRDTGYSLRLKGSPATAADKVLLTVVEFTKIKATIKSTPANTPANSAAMTPATPAPVDHTFESTSADPDFVANVPLVLMRNAQPDIKLELTGTPAGLPIQWDAVRNPADHATIGGAGDKPTRTRNAANFYECTLSANAKGSFRIRPFIDCNGSGNYEDLEPSIPMNLVLVDATMHADRSAPTTAAAPETINAARFTVSTGTWTTPAFTVGAADAMVMNLEVNLVGGGADGKLGLDQVFGGLQNQTQAYIHDATYVDGTVAPPTNHRFRFRYASNQASATGAFGGTRMFVTGDPAPVLYAMPLLDSGRAPNGLGGDTVTMSRSQTQLTAAQPAVGQRMEIWCIDSPRRNFPAAHPGNPNAVLTTVRYRHEFRADFVLWTNVNKVSGATAHAANRVYSVVRKVPWTLDGSWTLDYVTNPAAPTFVQNSYAVTSAGAATVNPVGRAQDHAIEVRPPSGITAGIVVDIQ